MVEFLNLYRNKKLQPKKKRNFNILQKRYPEDSKLDINKSIKNQINLLKQLMIKNILLFLLQRKNFI